MSEPGECVGVKVQSTVSWDICDNVTSHIELRLIIKENHKNLTDDSGDQEESRKGDEEIQEWSQKEISGNRPEPRLEQWMEEFLIRSFDRFCFAL